MKYLNWLAICLFFVIVVGCGDDGLRLVPVTGVVTLNGTPLGGVHLEFLPEPGTPGLGAGANADAAGEYQLVAIRPGALKDMFGVPPGKYKVIVSEPMLPIDQPVQGQTGNEPEVAIGLPSETSQPKKVSIPPRYSQPGATPLAVEVPQEGGVIDLKIEP